jgi:hypothetical protein
LKIGAKEKEHLYTAFVFLLKRFEDESGFQMQINTEIHV